MNKITKFEDSILDTREISKKSAEALISNAGKIIALLAAAITVAITFTDISFENVMSESFTSSLALIITSSYIIYFSLEEAGERWGMETEEFLSARLRYDSLRERITGDMIGNLRDFCYRYSAREVEFRQSLALLSSGLCKEDLENYRIGVFCPENERRLKKISEIKPITITPKMLLCRERRQVRSELENPEKRKLITLILKLIPSTLCMTVTVSVILTAKDGLSATDIITGLLKLSSLPLIGFKGYSTGYSYSKHSLSLWLETKANILAAFLEEAKEE